MKKLFPQMSTNILAQFEKKNVYKKQAHFQIHHVSYPRQLFDLVYDCSVTSHDIELNMGN